MKKHICMVAYTLYLSDARVRREAETLAAVPGYKVTVLALKGAEAPPQSYEKEGVQVRELGAGKYRGQSMLQYLLSYLKFTVLALGACTVLFLRRKVDVVHVHNMPNFLVFSAIVPRMFGRKTILDIHDTTIETYEAKFKRTYSRLLFYLLRLEELLSSTLAHRVICVNEVQREALVKRGIPERKMLVSMNVPDRRIFQERKQDTTQKKDTFKLVYFGTVTRRLGVDLAIRAVANVARSTPGIEFHVIGGGDDLSEYVSLSKELGAERIVRFYEKGFPLEELVKALDGMDLGLVPNRRSAATELMLPVKMLECVALGIPVVAPKLKTIRHYFPEDALVYFEPGDVDSLSKAILDAWTSEPMRREKAGNAKSVLKEYEWESHKSGLIDLYRSFDGGSIESHLAADSTGSVRC